MLATLTQRIASQVRRLRTAAGLSLDALAGKTGVSRSMLTLNERGVISPTAVILKRLFSGLNATLPTMFATDTDIKASNDPVQ